MGSGPVDERKLQEIAAIERLIGLEEEFIALAVMRRDILRTKLGQMVAEVYGVGMTHISAMSRENERGDRTNR